MGAILITSRRYYNFAKDEERKGDTVKQFTARQSWELLLELLGDEWKKADKEGTIPQSEIIAAKNMLEQLEGLALAIQQAAIMIKNPNIGGPTIAKTYERFKERMKTLPPRHSSPRSASEVPLDALWDMTFSSLRPHARTLLGVFSWLSPGTRPPFPSDVRPLTYVTTRFHSCRSLSPPRSKCLERIACVLQARTN